MYSHTKKAIILALLISLTPQVNYANPSDNIAEQEKICLAKAIYHEARGEPHTTKKGVAKVVLNRKLNKQFPKSICDIVNQSTVDRGKRICQFSWVCRRSSVNTKSKPWVEALALSDLILSNKTQLPNFNPNVLYFNRVSDPFSKPYRAVSRLGKTIFYEKVKV